MANRLFERIADRLKDAYPQNDRNNLCPTICFDDFSDIVDEVLAEAEDSVDAVEIVRCKDCVTRDLCIVEDHLVFAGWENPFCCAGKRKDGDENG